MGSLPLNQIVDEELLNGYLDNLSYDIVHQMIELYSQQSTIYLTEIEQAALSDSNSLWHQHCHKMKGAAASVGLKVLHAKLVEVEKSVAKYDEKEAIYKELVSLNGKGINAIKQWVSIA